MTAEVLPQQPATVDAGTFLKRLGLTTFMEEVWQRQWKVYAGVLEAADLPSIVSLAGLDRLIVLGGLPAQDVQMIAEGRTRAVRFTQSVAPALDSNYLLETFRKGTSFRVQHLENHLSETAEFCRGLYGAFGYPVRANAYISPAQSGGLHVHYDTSEALIVQLAGEKYWKIHSAYTNQVTHPLPEDVFDPVRHQPIGEPEHFLLRCGDVLYLPRGVMHSAFTADKPSVHITFSVLGLTWADLFARLVRQQAAQDDTLRALVPLWRGEDELASQAQHLWETMRLQPEFGYALQEMKLRFAKEKPNIPLGTLLQYLAPSSAL